MSGSLPEPLAEGELTRTPFGHLLLYAQKHALDGTMVLWDLDAKEGDPTQDRIRFVGGAPVAAVLTQRSSKLDRGLLLLCGRQRGPYAFYGDVDLVGDGEHVRTGAVEVFRLLAASLRGSARDEVVDHVVEGFGEAPLRMSKKVDLQAFDFLPDERACVDILRAQPISVAELVKLSPTEPQATRRLVYLLAITHVVDLWDGRTSAPDLPAVMPRSRHISGHDVHLRVSGMANVPLPVEQPVADLQVVPAPPPGLSREHAARWEEVSTRIREIDTENYFEMLGVERDASEEAIKTAYVALAKVWHPDRLPKNLVDLAPFVEQVFRLVTRAQETLCDFDQRGEYLANVQAGGGTLQSERRLGQIVQAALDFRKVDVLLQRRDWSGALALVEEILLVNDEEADYHAARGWILFQSTGGSSKHRADTIAALDRALELSEYHDKALYYHGMVAKRAGNDRRALDHFKRALDANPKNYEAEREVRLAKMRKEPTKWGFADALSGFLSGGKKK